MDARVQELLDWVETQRSSIEPAEVRKRVVALHGEVSDEPSRVSLIALYCAVTDLAERHLASQGKEVQPLRDARTADMRGFCLTEAMGESELVDPTELHRVVSREIAAGRMEQDSFAQLAADGAAVLGKPEPKKPGILRRIFG